MCLRLRVQSKAGRVVEAQPTEPLSSLIETGRALPELPRGVVSEMQEIQRLTALLSPRALARWPLILTTYETLSDEGLFVNDDWEQEILASLSKGRKQTTLLRQIETSISSISSQEVLSKAATTGCTRVLRRKTHRVVPSPLPRVIWWRLCLDEAQMIDVSTCQSAIMARKIPAVHRWCVSGEAYLCRLAPLSFVFTLFNTCTALL